MKKGLVFLAVVSVLSLVMLMACSGGSDSGNNDPQPQPRTISVHAQDLEGNKINAPTFYRKNGSGYEFLGNANNISFQAMDGETYEISVNKTRTIDSPYPDNLARVYVFYVNGSNKTFNAVLPKESVLREDSIGSLAQLIKGYTGELDGTVYITQPGVITNFKIYNPDGHTYNWDNLEIMYNIVRDYTNGFVNPPVNPQDIPRFETASNGMEDNSFVYVISGDTAGEAGVARQTTNDIIDGAIISAPINYLPNMVAEATSSFSGNENSEHDQSAYVPIITNSSGYLRYGYTRRDKGWGHWMNSADTISGVSRIVVDENHGGLCKIDDYTSGANASFRKDKSSKKKSSTTKIPKRIRKQNRPKTPLKQK